MSNKHNKTPNKRIMENNIVIVKAHCPFCFHHRAWVKPSGMYCSKCGYKI